MAFSRRLGVVWIAGASWLVAVGCDDSEDRAPGTAGSAGEAGEAPGGGKASVAGSQNNGGKAGASAGSSGSSGTGGTTSGGSNGAAGGGGDAGQAGGGGDAGYGGDMAGAAGIAGEATGGVGGAGGQGGGGAGGEGGELTAASCSFSCVNDDACVIAPNNHTYKCNPVSHRCEDPENACTADLDCLPLMSFWLVQCVDDAACAPALQACVNVSGKGFCADLSDPTFPDEPCFVGAPRTLSRFGAAGTVEVCASPDPRCFAGACAPGCGDPINHCGTGNGDTCSATTGLCECTQGTECTKTGVCGGDGHCQKCKLDSDCAATAVFDGRGVCRAGECSCADATTCINPYASAAAVCQ